MNSPYKELAEILLDLTGSESRLLYEVLPGDAPTQRQSDITLAREMLDWEPTIQLVESIKRAIAYFEGLLKGRKGRSEACVSRLISSF